MQAHRSSTADACVTACTLEKLALAYWLTVIASCVGAIVVGLRAFS